MCLYLFTLPYVRMYNSLSLGSLGLQVESPFVPEINSDRAVCSHLVCFLPLRLPFPFLSRIAERLSPISLAVLLGAVTPT